MIRKLFLGGLSAAVVAMALVPSSMAGGASVNKLTITGDGSFSGFVLSPNENCTANRKVTLYKRKSSVRKRNYKRDRKIDSDIATPNGDGAQWSIRDIPSRGKYYAHVKKKGSCKAMYSSVKRGTPAPEPEEGEEG